MSRTIPDHIARISPYVPGMPDEDLGGKSSAQLASNENPLGPSPRALRAVRSVLRQSHRYPEGGGHILRNAISRHVDLPPDQIILGNGSTELVEMLARTFVGSHGEAVMATPSFVMYRIAVQAVNGRAREVPLQKMRYDLAGLAAACGTQTGLAYIANPNNPTGTYVSKDELGEFLNRVPDSVLTVLDEAYAEYVEAADYPSGRSYVESGRRLIVLRTFSKAYGLAGLRIGYGLAAREVIALLERVRSPFNTSRVAQAAALAALEDGEHLERSRAVNRGGRSFLEDQLRRRGVGFVPSVANFLLVDLGRDAEEAYRAFLREGVIARPMSAYGLKTALRVTVGTPRDNRRFLRCLDRYIGRSPRS